MALENAPEKPPEKSSEKKKIRVLLIFTDPEPKNVSKAILKSTYRDLLDVTEKTQLTEAIEFLESTPEHHDLIIFEHNKSTQVLVKALFGLRPQSTFIMFAAEENNFEKFKVPNIKCEFILSSDFADNLHKVLKKFAASARIPEMPVHDKDDYVQIHPDSILLNIPNKNDIYIRIGHDHHIRLFHKDETIEEKDLQKYKDKKAVDRFYVKRSSCDEAIQSYAQTIEKLAQNATVTSAVAGPEIAKANKLVRDVIAEIGFTAEAQAVAKSSVNLALKAMGSSPKMATALAEFKKRDANYIGTHSYALGHVACALAFSVGWDSATTYSKLSIAAFLHDLSLTKESHAEVNNFEEAKKSTKFSPEELALIKVHPLKASEYAKTFTELPSDIDQIIAQHHEQPDGTGFPRELSGKLITPLSAIFIIAHAILDFVDQYSEATIAAFVKEHGGKYQVGQFKKIIHGLGVK